MGKSYDRIPTVTVEETLSGKRLEMPMSLEVLKKAAKATEGGEQLALI